MLSCGTNRNISAKIFIASEPQCYLPIKLTLSLPQLGSFLMWYCVLQINFPKVYLDVDVTELKL